MAVVRVRNSSGLRQEIFARDHVVVADEPVTVPGGTDAGPTPYELILAALGACTAMTVRMYAERKGWPLEEVEVVLSHGRVHADDCRDCEQKDARLERIEKRLHLGGPLTPEQRQRLAVIAERCPVNRTLGGALRIEQVLEPAAAR